jgi:drug/metabolite transporter (DMT)-like permease
LTNTGSVILTKVAADKLPKEKAKGIFWQFLFCLIAAIVYAAIIGNLTLTLTMLIVVAVGIVNAFGNYFQLQASGISLSRTTLFFPLMEVVTIALALIFLDEKVLWNAKLIIGILCCFLAMVLFRLPGDKGAADKKLISGWFLSVSGMILIFGVAGFLVKMFSFTLPRENFLAAWYFGALIGSLFITALTRQNPIKISGKSILTILPVSLTIIGALFTLYWTYQLGGPVSIILPIRGFTMVLIPALLGWWVFKERRGLKSKEWLGFTVGAMGAILILLK